MVEMFYAEIIISQFLGEGLLEGADVKTFPYFHRTKELIPTVSDEHTDTSCIPKPFVRISTVLQRITH